MLIHSRSNATLVAEHRRALRSLTRCGSELPFAIDVPAELEIEPPDIVRLLVQQSGLTAREGWVEPEPAFRRTRRLHADIGDEEMVLENLAGEIQPQHRSNGAAAAIRGNRIVCRH